MAIGDKIKALREAAGMSQAELARAAGLSQQAISKIEVNLSVSTRKLVAIARVFGKTAEELSSEKPIGKGSLEIHPRAIGMATKLLALSPKRRDLVLRLIEELQ
jgi:transcriptional regulator with XRE-family HTH domain